MRMADQPLLQRRIWDEDNIILILSHHILSLRLQCADDAERNTLDADRLADGILISKQLLHDGLTQQADFCCAADVRFPEKLTLIDAPVPDSKIIGRTALRRRPPVCIAVDDL